MTDFGANLAREIFDLAYVIGQFRLRSGVAASEYFDKYRFESHPRVLRQIVERPVEPMPTGTEALAGDGIAFRSILRQFDHGQRSQGVVMSMRRERALFQQPHTSASNAQYSRGRA